MAETAGGAAKAANDKRLAGILERIAKDRKAYEPMINSPKSAIDLRRTGRAPGTNTSPASREVIELSRREHRPDPSTRRAKPISKKVAVIAAESDAFLEKGINLNVPVPTPRPGRPPKVTIFHSGSC